VGQRHERTRYNRQEWDPGAFVEDVDDTRITPRGVGALLNLPGTLQHAVASKCGVGGSTTVAGVYASQSMFLEREGDLVTPAAATTRGTPAAGGVAVGVESESRKM